MQKVNVARQYFNLTKIINTQRFQLFSNSVHVKKISTMLHSTLVHCKSNAKTKLEHTVEFLKKPTDDI